MRHIKNIDRWYRVANNTLLVYEGDAERTVEIAINAVGPCVARLVAVHQEKGKWVPQGDPFLLGLVEGGREDFRWTANGNFAVVLETTGEAWVYRDMTPVSVQADESLEVFTRMEKAGLYMDDLGIALHRQAVLQRLQHKQQRELADDYTQSLEQRLQVLADQVEALTNVSTAETEQEIEAAADA